MGEDRDVIVNHYENILEEDRITVGIGQLELLRTQEILRRYLPYRPARILDIGGATGVHAAWLADEGHSVTSSTLPLVTLKRRGPTLASAESPLSSVTLGICPSRTTASMWPCCSVPSTT